MSPALGIRRALGRIRGAWKIIPPSTLFDYQFVHVEFEKKFAAEQRIGKLAAVFAALALFISGLGIFGMVSFVAEQRTTAAGVLAVVLLPVSWQSVRAAMANPVKSLRAD